MAIYEQDDVGWMNYELIPLWRWNPQGRVKDQSQLEKLLLDHITQINREADCTMDKRKRSNM